MTRRHLMLVGTGLIGLVVIGIVDREQAGQVLYCVLTAVALLFAYLYRSGSNWRVTEAGRALMSMVTMFAVFSAFVSTSYWLRGADVEDAKDWVRAVLLLVLILSFANLMVTLLRIQRHRSVRDELDRKICPVAEAEQRKREQAKQNQSEDIEPVDSDK